MPWLTDPSITNQMQPAPNPLDAYMRFAQLKNMGQEQQLRSAQLQNLQTMAPIQQQQAQADLQQSQQQNQITAQQQKTHQIIQQLAPQFTRTGQDGSPGMDWDGLSQATLAAGGDSSVIDALHEQKNKLIESEAKAGTASIDFKKKKLDDLFSGIQGVKAFPVGDPRRQQAYQLQMKQAHDSGTNVSQWPPQSPDDNTLTQLEGQLGMNGQLLADAKTKAEIDKLQTDPEAKNPTEASLALRAAQGDPTAEKALLRLDKSKAAGRAIIDNGQSSDIQDIADGIFNGDQPPTLQGLYRKGAAVRAELERRRFPLAQAQTDWTAVQKHIATLNGPQQTRLAQSISAMPELLDKVDSLYQEWKSVAPTSGFKVLNKASLTAMKQLPGRPGAVANALDAQIADAVGDLATIYMGGNSPTDKGIGLAHQALQSDWNDQSFTEALKQARANVRIRQNSIKNTGPAGVSPNSLYGGGQSVNSPGSGLSQPMGGTPVAPGGFDWSKFPEHK